MKYFLHDSNAFNDEKITQLYIKYGYEGVGLFYTALEKFASQEKPISTEVIKKQLHIGKRLNKCWLFMEEIGIICSSNGESFNKELLKFSEKYQIKKEKNAKRVAEFRVRHENVTHYERVSNAPKVKVSKVKVSKYISMGSPKPANPDIKIFLDYYSINYKEVFGITPIIDWGKDTTITKSLLAVYELAALQKHLLEFLKSKDDWVLKVGFSIGVFKTQINKIASKSTITKRLEMKGFIK